MPLGTILFMTATLRSTPSQPLRSAVELLSSMRFAISLLTVICIASVIGTVLKQGEPINNYINQFGPFWAEVFEALSLYKVYSAWWFLLILAFLVTSTSLCIARNTPKIIQDLKVYKENIREQSLQAFGLKAQAALTLTPEAEAQRIGGMLAGGGWKVKLQSRDTPAGQGWMVAAKAGAANKLGYIAAHSAIVLVCVGGLLDGELMVRAQMWWGGKSLYSGAGLIGEVPQQYRLGVNNPTFRGNLMVGEGMMANTAILNQPGGVLLQDLPIGIELKKFVVEHYSTGMPKLFASEIVIHDRETGEQTTARVEVNHPANYKGIEIYQSSFDDGGSSVKLRALPMASQARAFEVDGVIGGSTELSNGQEKLTLEYTSLRVMNVENFSGAGNAVDPRKVDLRTSIDNRLGAANKPGGNKDQRNVGPSITYKLRDAAGQAREFHNYMQPIDLGEGAHVFLLGLRDTPAEPFRYLRIPADAELSKGDFFRLKTALGDAAARARAVDRYVKKAVPPDRADMAAQLKISASRSAALFAGVGSDGQKLPAGGLQAVADFMQANVPESERERASEVLLRIVNGVLFELLQAAREDAKLSPLPTDAATQSFMTQSVIALSDVDAYPAPVAFELVDFKQVQASVFQVARAPGKTLVYLGCAFLILGIFAMLYVRERRLWVWLSPAGGSSEATMALSTNRKTMDSEREFEQLKHKLLG
jgi:cytochrome c biogenesis protein